MSMDNVGESRVAESIVKTDVERQVQPCNFRYAGRVSNENARTLNSLFEQFAVNASNSLELYLGGAFQLKLDSLEQSTVQDYAGALSDDDYLFPCALSAVGGALLMEIEPRLVFPTIDLLLGGTGAPSAEPRPVTEIDEQLMESVSSHLVREIEVIWRVLNLQYRMGPRVKPALVAGLFSQNERVVLLVFEMTVASETGKFKIALPASFVGFLLRRLQASQSSALPDPRLAENPTLDERIRDCRFTISADLLDLRVSVRDLVAMKPGTVLKLKSSVLIPGWLTVEGAGIFRATPVRSVAVKAAQVVAQPELEGSKPTNEEGMKYGSR